MTLAFVFPGQGSQSVGMLDGFSGNEAVRSVIDLAAATNGVDYARLIAQGPAEELNQTVHTQPVMLAAGYAFYQAWRAAGGPAPDWVAGHSLGEYTALTAASVFTLPQAVSLVRFRAEAMQQAVPVGVGGMAAILGMTAAAVVDLCAAASNAAESVEAVNFNDPGQTVIAGHGAAVERACLAAKAAGAKRALMLPVSAPFHSSLMKPAAERLAERLAQEELGQPSMRFVNNVDVAECDQPAAIKDALVRQAWRPVRWVETIQRFEQLGVTQVVECGPGKVLAGLIKRIAPALQICNISDQPSLDAALQICAAQTSSALSS